LILRLNDNELSSAKDFTDGIAKAWVLDDIVFLVQRGRVGYYVTFSL